MSCRLLGKWGVCSGCGRVVPVCEPCCGGTVWRNGAEIDPWKDCECAKARGLQ